MRPIVRRLKAALVISASWAVAWGTVGLLAGIVEGVRRGHFPGYPDVGHWWLSPLYLLTRFQAAAVIGAVASLVFTAVLAATARGHSVRSLSTIRTGVWGGVAGGGLFAVAWQAIHTLGGDWTVRPYPAVQLALATLAGAGLAALTLRIARRTAPGTAGLSAVGASASQSVRLSEGDAPTQPVRRSARVSVT